MIIRLLQDRCNEGVQQSAGEERQGRFQTGGLQNGESEDGVSGGAPVGVARAESDEHAAEEEFHIAFRRMVLFRQEMERRGGHELCNDECAEGDAGGEGEFPAVLLGFELEHRLFGGRQGHHTDMVERG